MKKRLDITSSTVLHCPKCGASEDCLELKHEYDNGTQRMIAYFKCIMCSCTIWEKENECNV